MQLKPEQLDGHLRKQLAPVYFISGDEPLRVMEAADAVRAAAREQGYSEREVLSVEAGFDWGRLDAAAGSLSLFAERRLIELRMSPKPGQEGGQALADYAANPAPDTVLLISCDKVDTSGQRTKWFKALEAAGVVIQVWPIERQALPGWISQRMQTRGLQVSNDAAALLADRVEGNLLAASQEIEKLLLLHGPGRIDVDAVSASVADSARFNVFTLVDNALSGHVGRTVHMLNGLRSEGIAPVVVSWALGREIRTMTRMAQAISEGQSMESVLAQYRVWERRKPLLRMALKRTPLPRWYGLLRLSGQVEKSSKGAAAGNPWDELLQLGARLAGAQIALRQARVI